MKYIKIAAIGLLFAAVLSSCKTTDDTEKPLQPGTGEVKFGKSEITVKENVGLFSIPLELEGEPGGYPVTVRIKAEVVGEDGKVIDGEDPEDLVYITTKTIKITESDNSFVQLRARYIPEVNAESKIKVTIESVNGAKIGAENSCLITIDNIYSIRYGLYTFSCPNSSKSPEWTLILRAGADGSYIMENLFDLAYSPKLVGYFDDTKKTLTFGGQLNGKGADNYFVLRTFGLLDGRELFLYGDGNPGFDPIIFSVSDKLMLSSTNSSFRIQTQFLNDKGETVSDVQGDAAGKSTLTHIGDSEDEEWPFN